MNRFLIVADSCCDLPLEIIKQHDIRILPMTVHFKHESFQNFPDQREISNRVFYNRLRERQIAKTSQLNPADFVSAIEPLVKEGYDILMITLSSALSGSYQSMLVGREQLLEKYPDRTMIIIDSLLASLGQGFLVYQAAQLKNEGQTLEAIAEQIESVKPKVCGLFTVEELGTLMRGGRISLTKAILGTLLNAKPALRIDANGKLVPFARARGKKNAILVLLNEMDRLLDHQKLVMIAHSDSRDEAERIKEEILKRHPDIEALIVGEIGPVIGAHTGPGAVGIFFIGTER